MKIFFASDHAGFELKNELLAFVRDELGFETEDCGALTYDENDDYPDFIKIAAERVSENEDYRGIILGGTGQGEAIAANRRAGVRAAVYYGGPEAILTLSREHNNANVLSLGARFLDTETAKAAMRTWLGADFSGEERHVRRIEKLG